MKAKKAKSSFEYNTCIYDDQNTLDTMGRVYREFGYLLCPHTAVAVSRHFFSPPADEHHRVYVATASPLKFPEAVRQALSSGSDDSHLEKVVRDLTVPVDHLRSLPRTDLGMERGQDWEEMLRGKIREVTERWNGGKRQ